MNKPVMITADSTCDLSAELLARFGIRTVPLHVHLGDKEYLDGVNFTQDMIFDAYAREKLLPTTSAVTPQEFTEFFTPILAEGCEIVHLDMSGLLSCAAQNAEMAAAELEGVHVIDTATVTAGIGLLLIEAARLRDEGRSAPEIAEAVRALIPKTNVSFLLDTLEFMWKGGRCSGVTAFGANLLRLKPCIEVVDARLEVCRKYRGNIRKVFDVYLKERLSGKKVRADYGIIISSAVFTPAEQEHIMGIMRSVVPFREIFFARTGCVISTHCGPDAMGVLFLEE